ncbi:MAG TPA: rhamnulokinase family protein [Phycisphaerae bacterium]|nr:rhamnulokinase family protein [Phycisphaerae bacterium]
MHEQRYIAVDMGAESGRVMVATLGDGGVLLHEVHRFANGPVKAGKTLYWDILHLWNEIQAGINRALTDHSGISGIGVDTWGVDFGLLDQNGELISNPVHYRDARTVGMPDKFFARIPKEKVYSITGIQTMPLNTLFQLLALAQNNPQILDRARHLLFTPDLIVYWLTGQCCNEYTIASTSQMLDAQQRKWSSAILDAIPIKSSLLPSLVMPGSSCGTVSADIGQATGIPVMAVGSHDTASAVAAVPAQSENWLFLSSGTWSLLGTEVDRPVLSPKALEYELTNEGGVGGKILLLKNIAGLWLLQECRRAWAKQGKEFEYRTLVQLAREEESHTTLLDIEDPSMLAPGDMPHKIVEQCRRSGQNPPTTPGQFTRVILETLAVTYARVHAMLAEVTGRRFTHLHIVGGGSQNELLNQMAADATGLEVLAGPVEATAIGNVLAQAIAAGQIDSLATGRGLVAKTAQLRRYFPHDTQRWDKWRSAQVKIAG